MKPFERSTDPGSVYRHVWRLGRGEQGAYAGASGGTSQAVQVYGIFDGAKVVFEGSLEKLPNFWFSLLDRHGNIVSFTRDGGDSSPGLVAYVRPVVHGGGGKTDLTVILLTGGRR